MRFLPLVPQLFQARITQPEAVNPESEESKTHHQPRRGDSDRYGAP